ncbi:hypothetical protein F511_39941 [Dorcoceras hygrometricum]|uniref:Uncharacterized protein n=1 Tax=Dorcoceras hygrometricum TaxID=472368 RepID=A0A2Z7CN57_9LAMI|nr:hypothetical protein F511_39941 [Dorcoceras hygrometricum]
MQFRKHVLKDPSLSSDTIVGAAVDPPIRSTTGFNLPPSICSRRLDGFYHGRNLLSTRTGASPIMGRRHVKTGGGGIQLVVGPQPLRLRNHNFGLAHRIMVKSLATSPHDPLGITDSACKNQLVVVSVQYGPFNTYIPIRSTTIGKSRVARDPTTMHTSWRSNSDITSVTSTGCVLGKWGCLVTLVMSLFDLQDVCIDIGSLATPDLPMVVDLIGIYVLKGPYSMLTTTNWFLQALSVIPRGSWDDVARRFTMIRWASPKL